MVDMYIVGDTEYNFDPNRVETSAILDLYLNQVRILLKTPKGSVMGYEDFGIDLEGLVFEKNLNEGTIKSEIEDAIKLYCSMGRTFTTNVNVTFFKGTSRDMCLIDIFIDGSKRMSEFIK